MCRSKRRLIRHAPGFKIRFEQQQFVQPPHLSPWLSQFSAQIQTTKICVNYFIKATKSSLISFPSRLLQSKLCQDCAELRTLFFILVRSYLKTNFAWQSQRTYCRIITTYALLTGFVIHFRFQFNDFYSFFW